MCHQFQHQKLSICPRVQLRFVTFSQQRDCLDSTDDCSYSGTNCVPCDVGPSLYVYLLTYLLTPWCRVLLEELTGLQLVRKFPAFHGTRRFINALTSTRHLSLSWTSPIQSIYPHPNSWRSILILSTHLRLGLPSGLLPSGFVNRRSHLCSKC